MTQADASSLPHQIDPDSLAALPRTSGVYIFKGEGTLPLYIGKSVDIRSRVLAHLRAEDEAEMIAQSRRVDYIETAGEIGALLLEARLIKQQSPLFNIRLRRLRNLCSIRLAEQDGAVIPEILSGKAVAVGQTDDLHLSTIRTRSVDFGFRLNVISKTRMMMQLLSWHVVHCSWRCAPMKRGGQT